MKEAKYDIFISYRRETGADTAKHLRDVLVSKGYSVFFDTDSLRSGSFNLALINVINSCKDFILILSPNSLDRCINEGDWVRQEIACAIQANKNIIPVMSSQFSFPEELPSDINDVRWRNGVTANIEYFDAMVEKLLSFLHSKPSKKSFIHWLLPIILIVLIAVIVLFIQSGKQSNTHKGQESILSDSYIKQLTNEGQAALDAGDYLTALQRFQAAAEQGEAVAQCNLGYMYSNGLGVELSHEKALQFYSLAAKNGDVTAITNIGYAYENGLGVEQSYEKAIEYYELGVSKGSTQAASYLAYMYDRGLGVEQSYEKAAEYDTLAANNGNMPAQLALGYYYEQGLGVEQSYEKALQYYQMAADQGNASSQWITGYMYESGKGAEQSYDKAVKYYELAAEQGNASAQRNLAYLYEHGFGTTQSYETAIKYYQLAAEQNDVLAQVSLGYLNLHGKGTEQSYEKALKYFQQAADQNNSTAQAAIGIMYTFGEGVEQSYEKGKEYYELAAADNNPTAYEGLAYLYENGLGVEQSYEKALTYYRLAVKAGSLTAEEDIERLENYELSTPTKIPDPLSQTGNTSNIKDNLGSSANSKESSTENEESNPIRSYSIDAVIEYCEIWNQYYLSKQMPLLFTYSKDSKGQLNYINILYNDDNNIVDYHSRLIPSDATILFAYNPIDYYFGIRVFSKKMNYDLKSIKINAINKEIKENEISNTHNSEDSWSFMLDGNEIYDLYTQDSFSIVLMTEENTEEIIISQKEDNIFFDMIMMLIKGSWYGEINNKHYLDKELLPAGMRNKVNNGSDNKEDSYSFKNDYDTIEATAQSLFYVEMYGSNGEWLGTNASGFVSFDEHVFITNQHVIEGASFLKIWDEKDNMFLLNHVIASDKTHDIAILMFPDGNKYTPLKQRTKLDLQRGQPVLTIGSPRGLQGTVDDGVISSLPILKEYGSIKCIQFSASISPGSSGGALFDNEGYVIGITTSTIEGQNLNFAIPITEVQKLYAHWDKQTYEELGTEKSWNTEGS